MNHKLLSKLKATIPIVIILATYLFSGLVIYDDYGISWDEPMQREHALALEKLMTTGNHDDYISREGGFHGIVFTYPLYVIEKAVGHDDYRDIYKMRHFATFVFFAFGLGIFYALLSLRFNSWRLASIGTLFLLLSPRIFGHSFFNPKDIPFLVLYLTSMYSFSILAKRKTLWIIILHALLTGLLIALRLPGLVTVPIAVLFLFFSSSEKSGLSKERFVQVYVFLSVAILTMIALYPPLWGNALDNFVQGFKVMARYTRGGPSDVLFQGARVATADLPWFYVPYWMLVSIPSIQLLLAAVGLMSFFFALGSLWRKSLRLLPEDWIDAGVIYSLIVPIVAVVLLGSSLYNGWRHLYFVAPPLIFFSVHGIRCIERRLCALKSDRLQNASRLVFNAAILVSLSVSIMTLIRLHPYEFVYFNALSGLNRQDQEDYLELDYWGLSYREGLEYIATEDSGTDIGVSVFGPPGYFNYDFLSAEDRARISIVFENDPKANYLLLGASLTDPKILSDLDMTLIHEIKAAKQTLLKIYRINKS